MTTSPARPAPGGWLHRYAILVSCATFLLVIAGGLVTSTGSGLAVPDWPLSFGQVFPRMEGGVLFEHGHRMVATVVGALTVVLAVWVQRAEPRRWVRVLGWVMLAVVIVQGLLGGLTVYMRLPDAVSVSHAGLAQVFFALTAVMATVTGVGFQVSGVGSRHPTPDTRHQTPDTRLLTLITALAVYAQILLGAIVRHTGAALAIPDFPLAFGRLVPSFTTSLVMWNYLHRLGALAVTVLIAWTAYRIATRHGTSRWLVRPTAILIALVCGQILLGALTIWTRRAVTPTTAHVAVGALVFVVSVVLAVRSHRALGEVTDGGPRPAEPAAVRAAA